MSQSYRKQNIKQMMKRISEETIYQNQTALNRFLSFSVTKMKHFQRYYIPLIFKVENFNQKE